MHDSAAAAPSKGNGTRGRSELEVSVDIANANNELLRRLSSAERQRLAPLFERTALSFKQTLHEQDQPIRQVYFPEEGVISIVTALDGGEPIETGIVGSEGLAGIAAVLGGSRAFNRTMCQIPGAALTLPATVLDAEREAGSPWFRVLLRYVNFFCAQLAQSVACNRAHSLEARMSRWLLTTHDRLQGDAFPLTQEFLAQMLGVTRPSVNLAGATLQRAGFIRYARGRITVVDRAGLESVACECYARIRGELAQTF